jgi:hypothetical protein
MLMTQPPELGLSGREYSTQPTKTVHTLKYVDSPDSQGFSVENSLGFSHVTKIRNGNFFIAGSILTDLVLLVLLWAFHE